MPFASNAAPEPMTTRNSSKTLRQIPAGIWVLGFVSMLMDISSEMIHSLLRAWNAKRRRSTSTAPALS